MPFRDLYRFKEDLMDGMYGPILRCADLSHGERDVAVKIVSLAHQHFKTTTTTATTTTTTTTSHRATANVNPLKEKEFLQQLQATSGHPNVLQCHQIMAENHGQILIYIMEYCHHGDLLNVMNHETPHQRFEERHALGLFAQVVAGVKFLHDHGIAHRDLSLENVLVNDQNVCKVSDFGLSCKTSQVCHDAVGKSYYMAPEMLANKAYHGVQADIWSLGIILFIMLTGSPLCELASEDCLTLEILKMHGVGKILQLWGLPNVASEPTLELLNGMLQVVPTQRLSLDRILSHPALRS